MSTEFVILNHTNGFMGSWQDEAAACARARQLTEESGTPHRVARVVATFSQGIVEDREPPQPPLIRARVQLPPLPDVDRRGIRWIQQGTPNVT